MVRNAIVTRCRSQNLIQQWDVKLLNATGPIDRAFDVANFQSVSFQRRSVRGLKGRIDGPILLQRLQDQRGFPFECLSRQIEHGMQSQFDQTITGLNKLARVHGY